MPPFSLKNATRTQISIRSLITIHFYTGVTPATYRLDAFRINYRKGGLIGTYVYLALQKPFRESPSSGTSHSLSRGTFHDRNGKMTATKILRSAGDAARLCARYHLPSSLDGAECHHDQQKQFTRRRQQQLLRKQPFPWHCAMRGRSSCFLCENTKRIVRFSKPQVFFRKCPPCIVLVIGIMLFGCDIYSLFPLYSAMAILVITYVILFLPYTAEYVISA